MLGQVVSYIRVSSVSQNTDRQHEAIGKVDREFIDKATGKNADRPALAEMLKYVRDGDTVKVASMDRLARSLRDLQEIVSGLNERGVAIEFLKERLIFGGGAADKFATFQLQMLGAVAQLEVAIINERQAEGIALAKVRPGGYHHKTRRAPKLDTAGVEEALRQIAAGKPKAAVARDLGVSRQTLYSAISLRR